MSSQDANVGEQAISKLAEEGIKSQLDQVESLDVDIRTDPIKVAQGEVDEATIKGRGMVIQNDLRTEEMTLRTGAVDIDMIKAAFGNIALEHPTDATARVVLKAEDIQNAFNADYVQQKLRGQKVELPSGEKITTDASNVSFTIPETGRVAVAADVMIFEKAETHHIAFSAIPKLVAGGYGVTLEDVSYEETDNDMPALTQGLIDTTESLLDLKCFELEGMELQFDQLTVKEDSLLIEAGATISSFD
ncbi:hypothetical protein S7335_3547 [Synechococcus sp. PCC 7335]|uniref:LmeA family phospholipid-binding protein n=1 Tax=Synechococcus sp. (strain ATCC 29403 / PCC 7335) TaxID=91464 RepID=UPI00017ECAEF|nr:DUF2993 domain-containing protein [Synechococcus sp. PCC 7335]EDX85844.1 hypothetical protein S7335_3547 [Synechococcus sp. PCC 7335]